MNENEIKGREIFELLALLRLWNIEFTTDIYNTVDFHINIKGYDGVGEIKLRDSEAIKYDTHIITLHKINALLKELSSLPMFVNIIGNENIYIYNIKKLALLILNKEITPYLKWLPNHHVNNSEYHYEQVIEVSKDTATHFKRINNKWYKL